MFYSPIIQLVDDERDIATIFAEVLRLKGFEVHSFINPLLALQDFVVNSDRYAMVISDVRMPRMSGFEFAMHVRRIKPGIKLILMTAFETNDIPDDTIKAIRVNEFLRKPLSCNQLQNAVAKHLHEGANIGISNIRLAKEAEAKDY